MKNHKELIDLRRVPKHIAIIMDGNRRWAEKRSLPGIEGHKKGAEILESLVESAYHIGVEVFSIFTFSTENWSRSNEEVKGLWQILEHSITQKGNWIQKNGVRVVISGAYERLPAKVVEKINDLIELTKNNKKFTINACLNYGGYHDIVNAVNKWLKNRKSDELLTENIVQKNLYTTGLPEIELMIRPGGECRISNFLLWQLAYSELIFLDILWPDFKPRHLYKAIYDYQLRERRYGE